MPKAITLAAMRALNGPIGRNCQHGTEIAKLTKAERREYEVGLADRTIQLPAILHVLTERGLRINQTSLYNHRRGRCRHCFGTR